MYACQLPLHGATAEIQLDKFVPTEYSAAMLMTLQLQISRETCTDGTGLHYHLKASGFYVPLVDLVSIP